MSESLCASDDVGRLILGGNDGRSRQSVKGTTPAHTPIRGSGIARRRAHVRAGIGSGGKGTQQQSARWPNTPVRHTLKQNVRATTPSFAENLRGDVAVAGCRAPQEARRRAAIHRQSRPSRLARPGVRATSRRRPVWGSSALARASDVAAGGPYVAAEEGVSTQLLALVDSSQSVS